MIVYRNYDNKLIYGYLFNNLYNKIYGPHFNGNPEVAWKIRLVKTKTPVYIAYLEFVYFQFGTLTMFAFQLQQDFRTIVETFAFQL